MTATSTQTLRHVGHDRHRARRVRLITLTTAHPHCGHCASTRLSEVDAEDGFVKSILITAGLKGADLPGRRSKPSRSALGATRTCFVQQIRCLVGRRADLGNHRYLRDRRRHRCESFVCEFDDIISLATDSAIGISPCGRATPVAGSERNLPALSISLNPSRVPFGVVATL
jgi:hypothetical protein